MEALFPESPHFLEQLRHLGSANQDEVVATFIALAKSDVNPEKDGKLVHKEVLSVILERVAFFPMKPAVMEVRGTLTAFQNFNVKMTTNCSIVTVGIIRQSCPGLAFHPQQPVDSPQPGPQSPKPW